jgi:hypothetical protein
MHWGMAQTPPLFKRSPFHRFGVRMNKKAKTVCDRRLVREAEKKQYEADVYRSRQCGSATCPHAHNEPTTA